MTISPAPFSNSTDLARVDWVKLQNGSDIRGVALEGVADEPVNLTGSVVTRLGRAFATWLSAVLKKPAGEIVVSVGRDSRLSGPELMLAAIAGLTDSGCDVLDFGIASTPAMFMSTVLENSDIPKCDGAIMLTASHLPFNRNGLKFFTETGGLDKKDIKAILQLAEVGEFETAGKVGTISQHDFISVYAARLVDIVRKGVNHPEHFDRPLQGLKIVMDAGNGAGGFYCDRVLARLGADTTGSQFLDPDGTFPNHVPNPENAEAMASICQAVVENQADFGIIFDTDVDRGAAVDSSGSPLNRNRLIALMSAIVLREHPGSTIVTDSITSDGLAEFIQDLGGVHHRYRRGYKNVINESQRLNGEGQESWLAIETSGHGAMRENYFLDDGAYLVTKLLVELAKSKLDRKSLVEVISTLKEPVESKEFRMKIEAEDFKGYGEEVIAGLKEFAETHAGWEVVPNNYEGVRVACTSPEEDGWFLLRLSLHDPVMPLNIESNVEGGVKVIGNRLLSFLQNQKSLGLEAFGR